MMIGSTRKDKLPKDTIVSALHPDEYSLQDIAGKPELMVSE